LGKKKSIDYSITQIVNIDKFHQLELIHRFHILKVLFTWTFNIAIGLTLVYMCITCIPN